MIGGLFFHPLQKKWAGKIPETSVMDSWEIELKASLNDAPLLKHNR